MSVHPARSFDRAADAYEANRPDYPDAVLDHVPVPREAEVLDVGAGTGKLTRVLAGRYRRVTAVEPLDGMRAILERMVPRAEAHSGTAEQIPLRDASVDAVFAGQAFHWFANDDAIADMARVLRPGGVLALVWNEPRGRSPLPQAYHDALERLHEEGRRRLAEAEPWQDVIRRGPFGPVRQAHVDHEQEQSRASVLATTQTFSWVACRTEDERARIARELDELLGDGPFVFGLRANVMWAVRS
ncbi:MAG TPA: class I SAM-dependent methyltransferase [Gaiellaceae bacterium]|nr:class I SAM-dependent methyltransferase [Gaiellaceae bacterium]